MTKKFTYTEKQNGSTLSAAEWNNLAQDVDAAVDAINNGGVGGGSSEYLTLSAKNNVEISSPKHINIEPAQQTYENGAWTGNAGDIQIKPGDDISLYSSHRGSKTDEVSVKVLDDSDHPVKLQIQAGEITLQAKQRNLTKAKDENTGAESENDYQYADDQANVFDINVTTEYKPNRGTGSKKSGKGYLKVRAQAIDLRCEENGGIAIQPKGVDGDGNMNKIKFEHGGGDGLEFGTFNTEHTSIYTGDYRFKKDGVIRLANRFTVASDKADENDQTTAYKYLKNNATNNSAKATQENKTFNAADDFYDFVDSSDPTCTWEDIVTYIAWAKANNQGPWAN